MIRDDDVVIFSIIRRMPFVCHHLKNDQSWYRHYVLENERKQKVRSPLVTFCVVLVIIQADNKSLFLASSFY